MSWWLEFIPGLFVLMAVVACLLILRQKGLARFNLFGVGAVGNSKRQIRLLDRHVLSAQHTLYLVKVGQVKMLLGGAPASCQLVAILPDGEDRFDDQRSPGGIE